MKTSIMQKLLLLVSLPIVMLTIFSIISINNQYSISKKYQDELVDLRIMQSSSNLIHHIQIERVLSSIYINENKNNSKQNLLEHRKKTDKVQNKFLLSLKELTDVKISISNKKYIANLVPKLLNMHDFREKIINLSINNKELVAYYSNVINTLILILNGFQVEISALDTNLNILALSRIISLQEYAGLERALTSNIATAKKISQNDFSTFQNLIASQNTEKTELKFLLENTKLKQDLENIEKTYNDNFFQVTRDDILVYEKKKNMLDKMFKIIGYGGMTYNLYMYKQTNKDSYFKEYSKGKISFDKLIKQYISLTKELSNERRIAQKLQNIFFDVNKNNLKINNKKNLSIFNSLKNIDIYLNADTWFTISTKRINEFHTIESKLFSNISKSINSSIQKAESSLIQKIFLSLFTIIFLLFGTYYIAKNIKYSIYQLKNGIDNFFKFLNFQIDKPESINTSSNDEINEMAISINTQIKAIEEKLKEDITFINETTQVVTLMKDGNFEESLYFEPHNPYLKDLKNVFDELIKLINKKIKEQTNSLKELNGTLQDEVYYQTLELEIQVKEITLSRDKAIQAEIAKDEFLANMSHEIRTPLNAILGFVGILKKKIKEEESVGHLDIIYNSGNSLLTIINDILDFSKIQSGKFSISKHPVNPINEFTNAALLFASKAYEKNIVYAVYIDPKLPKSLELDAIRVTQIISNLLSNAIKFTPEDGEIKLKVILKDNNLVISIQDNGIGISEKNLSKIFSAFEQADGSTTRKYGGTGLGLSISSKLAVLMEGKLSVKSKENKGSTFTLTLPTKIIDAQTQEFLDTSNSSICRVAILDNSRTSSAYTKLIKKYLNDFGMNNITEIQHFEENFDLIFFIPDDEYNEEIVNAKIPSVAMLRSNTIKLADFKHIEALYAPFVPKSIVESISNMKIKQEPKHTENIEIKFKGNILVAEDNKTNQMLISFLLDDYGLEYKIANNGVEAVEFFKEGSYDLVLMDENMPELNGIGAMKQIKEYEQKNSLILTPIIALTASVLKSDKEMFTEAGMDGFVGKPIDNKELESELSRYLKKA